MKYFRYPVGLGPSCVMAEDYGLLEVEAGEGWDSHNLTRNISAVMDNVSLPVEDTRLCNLRDFQVEKSMDGYSSFFCVGGKYGKFKCV